MPNILFSLNGRKERVDIGKFCSGEELMEQLCCTFGMNSNSDIIGIKDLTTDKIYSLGEIIDSPSLFEGSTGIIISGPLSPNSKNKRSSVIEQIFQYVFKECNKSGAFRYLDYFVLRTLYNCRSSSLTAAVNLLVDGNTDALNLHLHTLITQMKNSVSIKMGVLRLITVNMQINGEISSVHASVLLSLIGQEDGLICAAYTTFENDDNLAQLKDTLLRILLLSVNPRCISSEERRNAIVQQSQNRGSWRPSCPIDVVHILQELISAQLLLYTLQEVSILTESETVQLLQLVNEYPDVLDSFEKISRRDVIGWDDPHTYRAFLEANSGRLSTFRHTSAVKCTFPAGAITEKLLELHQSEMISRTEYISLYRRCTLSSPVLLYCYESLLREKDFSSFTQNIRESIILFDAIHRSSIVMRPEHAAVLQRVAETQLMTEEEIKWVQQEVMSGNDVVESSLDLCAQTGDLSGLVAMLHSILHLLRDYELQAETRECLGVLVREMVNSGGISQQTAMVLTMLLQEPDRRMCDLYTEYQQFGNFERLLESLICLGSSGADDGCTETETSESVEEEEGLILPSREEAVGVIRKWGGEFTDEREYATIEEMVKDGNADMLFAIAKFMQNRDESSLRNSLKSIYEDELATKAFTILTDLRDSDKFSFEELSMLQRRMENNELCVISALIEYASNNDLQHFRNVIS